MVSVFRNAAIGALAATWAGLAQGPRPALPTSPAASVVPAPGEAPSEAAGKAASVAPAVLDPLPGLVREALRNNPSLRAARLEPEADRQESRMASAWEAPRVGVEFFNAPVSSFPNPLKEQAEIDYIVEQAFSLPGKRAAMAQPFLRRAEAGEAKVRALEIAVEREVKEAYLEVYMADAGLRLNADNQAAARRMVEVARRQYELGMGGQGDILKAHAELASLSLEAVRLSRGREEAVGRLNALLDRAPDSAFSPPEDLRPVPARLPFVRVLALARGRHPDLAAMDAEIRAREAEAAAQGRELWPDVMVRGSYKDMREPPLHGGTPEDGWSLMVGVDLPFAFWSAPRYRSGYRSAGRRAEMARLDRRSRENALAAEVRSALASLEASAEGLELARSAIRPHAEQALRSIQAAYDNGKAGFAELMEAYRMAIGARGEELEAVVQAARSRADLEAAVGMDIDEIARTVADRPGEGGRAPDAPAGTQGGRP